MNPLLRHTVLAIAVMLLTVTILVPSQAADDFKQREMLMKSFGGAMKSTVAMVRGRRAYDADLLRQNAERIMTDAKRIADVFPAGSPSSADNPDSEAKPLIWEQWGQFTQHADDLAARADDLAQLAGDRARVPAAFKAMAMVCSSCHQTYRIKK